MESVTALFTCHDWQVDRRMRYEITPMWCTIGKLDVRHITLYNIYHDKIKEWIPALQNFPLPLRTLMLLPVYVPCNKPLLYFNTLMDTFSITEPYAKKTEKMFHKLWSSFSLHEDYFWIACVGCIYNPCLRQTNTYASDWHQRLSL